MNEDRLAQAMSKAQQAKQLLENELLTEVLEELKHEYAEIAFTTDDMHERERVIYARRAFDAVRMRLSSHVTNGNVARREMDDITSGAKRAQFGIV